MSKRNDSMSAPKEAIGSLHRGINKFQIKLIETKVSNVSQFQYVSIYWVFRCPIPTWPMLPISFSTTYGACIYHILFHALVFFLNFFKMKYIKLFIVPFFLYCDKLHSAGSHERKKWYLLLHNKDFSSLSHINHRTIVNFWGKYDFYTSLINQSLHIYT